MALFSYSYTVGSRKSKLSCSSSSKGTKPFMRAPPSCSNYLPKASPPHTIIILGVRTATSNLGVHRHLARNSNLMLYKQITPKVFKKIIYYVSWFLCIKKSVVVWLCNSKLLFFSWSWVIEGLTGAGGPVSIAGKVVMGAGGSPWFLLQTRLRSLVAWRLTSPRASSQRKQGFYGQASEILHSHFHHMPLDTQATSNLVRKGQHKDMKARQWGSSETGYHNCNV